MTMTSPRPRPVVSIPLLLTLALGVSVGSNETANAETPNEPRVEMIRVEGEGATYWSRWRGPSGQGIVEGSHRYPDRWSSEQNVRWRTRLEGEGNSSPIVWDEKIFLTAAYDGGARIAVSGFDRDTGERLWEEFVPQSGIEHVHGKNGHASATPVTDGERVIASFGTHGIMAVSLDGERLWHHEVGELDNYHGSAGSPVLYDDLVILYQDHRKQSFVLALDKETGEVVWRTERDAKTGWGTPVIVRVSTPTPHDELIVSSQGRVTAYAPDTGRELWTAEGNLFEVIPTPVVGHDLVFCSSGRSGPTLAIRPGGHGDVTSTHIVWSSPKGSPFVPSPIIVGDNIYMINDMLSIVTAHRARTGKLVFQGRLGSTAKKEGFSASPVNIGDKIFFTNDDGETFVLRAGDEFELMHVNRIGARTLASPALVGGSWYFRTEHELLRIAE